MAWQPGIVQHSVVLASAEGIVQVRSGDAAWQEATQGYRLAQGAQVRVSDGAAVVELFDGSRVQLERGAEVELSVLRSSVLGKAHRIVITQRNGYVIYDVVASGNPRSAFTVSAPAASVAAKGDAFAVNVEDTGPGSVGAVTRVVVLEGQVEVTHDRAELFLADREGLLISSQGQLVLLPTLAIPSLAMAYGDTHRHRLRLWLLSQHRRRLARTLWHRPRGFPPQHTRISPSVTLTKHSHPGAQARALENARAVRISSPDRVGVHGDAYHQATGAAFGHTDLLDDNNMLAYGLADDAQIPRLPTTKLPSPCPSRHSLADDAQVTHDATRDAYAAARSTDGHSQDRDNRVPDNATARVAHLDARGYAHMAQALVGRRSHGTLAFWGSNGLRIPDRYTRISASSLSSL